MLRELAMAAALFGSVSNAAPAQRHMITTYGYYDESCARVVNGVSQHQDEASKLYALGVWTGLNMGYDIATGHATDSDGIWGEIKLFCSNHPSEKLLDATVWTYFKLKTAGR